MSEEAEASGKLEPVSAGGQAVTGFHPQFQLCSCHTSESHIRCLSSMKPKPVSEKSIPKNDQQSQLSPPPSLSLPTHRGERLAKFIGEKTLTQCSLNGVAAKALLDTGAQVSMIDRGWMEKHLPGTVVRPLSEAFDDKEELEVHAVNGDVLPFDGWILITVSLGEVRGFSESIIVPFLVSSIPLEQPLLGFNVLEEVIHSHPAKSDLILTSLLSKAITILTEKAELLVSFIQAGKPSMQHGHLRTGTYDTVIPADQVTWVKCQVPTIPDRHPLPRIQDMTDTLGGYSLFSILDQGKAYHQGFIAKGSQHLTAFITPWGLYE
ncbi:hypothetical protein SRHO_G00054600 [Serrasalmus rhombeus]